MTDGDTLVRALDSAGYRLTEPRRAVAGLIGGRRGYFTAADLLAEVKARRLGIGRATIFRALDLFTELNLVERVDLPNGEHAYVECARAHHHHVICSSCGRTSEVEDRGMQAVAEEVARQSGYTIHSHRLELFGICPKCAARGAADRQLLLT
jgi:Fur family ferric uptake transcriptional regulator